MCYLEKMKPIFISYSYITAVSIKTVFQVHWIPWLYLYCWNLAKLILSSAIKELNFIGFKISIQYVVGATVTKQQEEEELYYLAMNNNSTKRKQKPNYLVTPRNKKTTRSVRSSRGESSSSMTTRTSPLRMDLGLIQDEDLLRFLSNGAVNPVGNSESSWVFPILNCSSC